MKRRLLNAVLCLLAALLLCGAAAPAGPTLAVHVFDAGKADAILLTTAEGAVLIDTGEKGFGKEIVAYCRKQGIERIDCLILTHFDKDHVGGAAKVINKLPVGQILQSNYPKESAEMRNYLNAAEKAGLKPLTLREELRFTLGGVAFTVNPPAQAAYASSPSNNSSLIVTADCGARRLLFLGDAENARLAEFLAADPGTFDLVKLPHHGAWHRMLPQLLEQTRPSLAIITSSDEEPEEAKTAALLESLGIEALLTREDALDLFCDGQALTVAQRGTDG